METPLSDVNEIEKKLKLKHNSYLVDQNLWVCHYPCGGVCVVDANVDDRLAYELQQILCELDVLSN